MSTLLLRIATRQSALALWQARHVAAALKKHHPHCDISLVPITTRGDKILDTPLARIGGKGLFIKELETALLEGRAELAVHSMKDLGATLPEGLSLGAVLTRGCALDAWVGRAEEELPKGAVVGTCSLRRRMNLLARRPDLILRDLRGNVQTRLAKLDAGDFDAIVLAGAGLQRLALEPRIRRLCPPEESLPAIAQGAIGVECRADPELLALLAPLNDPETRSAVEAERILNATLAGSCQIPLAAYARRIGDFWRFSARMGYPDGTGLLDFEEDCSAEALTATAQKAASWLQENGALDILQRLSHGAS